MAALVDARIRMLIDGYERRIADLQDEIQRFEGKVDALTNALVEARAERSRSLEHFDDA
jgi:flagellar biosynthesis chaperone FliJ